ncbi:MAG: hypothetical protein R2711_11165 [Acidimicrobiales bacterium]
MASSAVGPFAELPLGQAMAAHSPSRARAAEDPVCELVSIAITRNAGAERIDGLAEAMYRSFYQRAVAPRAASIAVAPSRGCSTLQEEYGIPFQSLALLRRRAAPCPRGRRVADPQAGTLRANPSFAAYLGIALDLPVPSSTSTSTSPVPRSSPTHPCSPERTAPPVGSAEDVAKRGCRPHPGVGLGDRPIG